MILSGSLDLWQRLAWFLLSVASVNCLPEGSADIREVLKLAEPVGRAIKNQVRAKDLAIGKLSGVFLGALKPLLERLLPPQQFHGLMRWIRRYIDVELSRRLAEDRYIASFSLCATNPTMWGHYAGAETGFVIVFTSSNDSIDVRSPISILHGTRPSKEMAGCVEIGIYKDQSLELKKVEYSTRRPKVNAFHQLIPMLIYTEAEDYYDVPESIAGDTPRRHESIFGLVKPSSWRYEKEVRAFFPTFGYCPPDVRVLRVASRNMLGLIFGPRMSQSDLARAVVCCHLMRHYDDDDNPTDFVFFQAEQQIEGLSIGIKPVGILGGPYFGEGLPLPVKPISELPVAKANVLREISKKCSSERGQGPTGQSTLGGHG
jgi:hypothetical protein